MITSDLAYKNTSSLQNYIEHRTRFCFEQCEMWAVDRKETQGLEMRFLKVELL